MPISQCLDYYSFIVGLEFSVCFRFVLLFQNYFESSGPFHVSFIVNFPFSFLKIAVEILVGIVLNLLICLGELTL